MEARLAGKRVVIIGAGQTGGETLGNGRAVSVLFAREGARLLLVDRDEASLAETQRMIRDEGFDAETCNADVLQEDDCARVASTAINVLSGIDVLHYNVGVSEGDAEVSGLDVADWDRIINLNLRGFMLCSKYALPVMREAGGGVILGISSAAAIASTNSIAYKASKAGMNALVQSMAVDNGKYGIRVNAIMPGLMDTPMAIERRARETGVSRDDVRASRDRVVPLGKKMGSAWDVAYAALFLASDEARYVSGVSLAVDGALTARVG